MFHMAPSFSLLLTATCKIETDDRSDCALY